MIGERTPYRHQQRACPGWKQVCLKGEPTP